MARRKAVIAAACVFVAMLNLSVASPSMAVNFTVNGALGDLDGNGDGGTAEAAVLNAAVACWAARVSTNRNFTLTVNAVSLTGGTLGTGFVSAVNAQNIPTAGTVNIDNDGSSAWYVDPAPGDSLEFTTPDPNSQWRFTTGPAGTDLLSAVNHEIGHAMGWICGASCGRAFAMPRYDGLMNPAPASFVANATCVDPFPLAGQAALAGCVFLQEATAPHPLNTSLRGDGVGTTGAIGVVNELSHPGVGGDMMLGILNPGIRETHSFVDVDMFGHAFGDTINLPPTANAGAGIVSECSQAGGAIVTLNATGSTDPEGATLTFNWGCSSGISLSNANSSMATGVFPNNQTVTCRVDVNDVAACAPEADVVNVSVQDTTPPTITCPANTTVEVACTATAGTDATNPQVAAFLAGATATDVCDASAAVTDDAPAFFPMGSTLVTFSASDDSGNSASCSATLSIVCTCFGQPATLVGTPGNDVLLGTNGDDVIVGLGGNDLIKAFGGNDRICAGDGDDAVEGGAGDDMIDGGDGRDLLKGQAGNDVLLGGDGDDVLEGGPGTDSLDGGPGNNLLKGGTGADICINGPTIEGCNP